MITLTLTLDQFPDGETIEDAVAVILGGLGYTGYFTNSLTGNEVHFPVMNQQALDAADNALSNARAYAGGEVEDEE